MCARAAGGVLHRHTQFDQHNGSWQTFSTIFTAPASVYGRGVMVSDPIKQPQGTATSRQMRSEVRLQVGVRDNPVEVAEMRYIREHGATGLSHATEGLSYDLFPPQTQGEQLRAGFWAPDAKA